MSEAHPLTSDQRQTLEQAAERAKAFTGAAKVAAFNGWSIGFFAAVTLLFDIFSLTALVLGVGMAVVARNEFESRARIPHPQPHRSRASLAEPSGFHGTHHPVLPVEHVRDHCAARIRRWLS